MSSSSPYRTRPLVALRALATLAADPDDLAQVFTIIESLPARAPQRMLARFRATEGGRRLLATKPDLGARLADRAALHALPAGTLGRAYAELMDREQITPQGLVDASIEGRQQPLFQTEDERFLADRMRDTHDLWHAATGYGMDLLGEAALLAFIYVQTRNPGIAVVGLLGFVKAERPARRTIYDAYRRGRSAEWLPAVVWEDLLDQPLAAVRQRLRLGSPPVYEPVTSASLRASGALAPRRAA